MIEPQGLLAHTALNGHIKAVADAYFEMRTRVADLNIWRNLPSSHPPVSSQLWHRDQPDDYFILKMFVYLEDVTEGSGPLSYATGTHGKGDRTWKPANTWHDSYNLRAHDVDMDRDLPEDRRPRFTGPAGTVILADTHGWHKGGQATTSPRLLLQVLYASPGAATSACSAHPPISPGPRATRPRLRPIRQATKRSEETLVNTAGLP